MACDDDDVKKDDCSPRVFVFDSALLFLAGTTQLALAVRTMTGLMAAAAAAAAERIETRKTRTWRDRADYIANGSGRRREFGPGDYIMAR